MSVPEVTSIGQGEAALGKQPLGLVRLQRSSPQGTCRYTNAQKVLLRSPNAGNSWSWWPCGSLAFVSVCGSC